jgi:hypothetical protein
VTAISRHVIDWDDKGFPCLADDCPDPKCGATALIINEWNAVECLSCSWREFEPDDARADYDKWPDESRAIDPEWTAAPPRRRMTAVLAAIARAVLAAILLLVTVAAMLWAWAGPQEWPMLAWLLAVCAVVVAAGLCASALQPEGDER